MPSEVMTLPRIAVDRRVCFASKYRLDLSLRCLGNELVLLSQMHKEGRTKIVDLAQVLFGVSAVISDGGIDVAAHGRQERHQGAEAVALDGNLARALRDFGHSIQGVADISDASVTIIGLIKAKAVLPVSLRGDAKVNARLLTPEQVGCDRYKALLGQSVTGFADVGIDPEQLLQNNDSRSRQSLRPCDIGVKRAIPASYADAIFHLCFPQTTFIRAFADVARIGGGLLSKGPGSDGGHELRYEAVDQTAGYRVVGAAVATSLSEVAASLMRLA